MSTNQYLSSCVASVLAHDYMLSPPFTYDDNADISKYIHNVKSCVEQVWDMFPQKELMINAFNIDEVTNKVTNDIMDLIDKYPVAGYVFTSFGLPIRTIDINTTDSRSEVIRKVFPLIRQIINRRIVENITTIPYRVSKLDRWVDKLLLVVITSNAENLIKLELDVSYIHKQKNGRYRFTPNSVLPHCVLFPKGSLAKHTDISSARYMVRSVKGTISTETLHDTIVAACRLYQEALAVVYID